MNVHRFIATGVAALFVALLSGCAAYKLDKTVTPDPAYVKALEQRIEKMAQFQQALYEVGTFAVDQCARQSTMEPFALMTVGTLPPHLKKEELAAYWHAGGLDEKWRVLWAEPGIGLSKGDAVESINGDELENNGKTAYVLNKWFPAVFRARDAAAKGKPFTVRLESGKEVVVPTRPGCRTILWSVPVAQREEGGTLVQNPSFPQIVAPNAVHLAENRDELRYLAALGVYWSASPEADGRQGVATASAVVMVGAAIAMPLLYPVLNAAFPFVARAVHSGMVDNAALFATRVVAAMGGNPRAGLDLVERLEREKLPADRVLLNAESKAVVEELVAQIRSGKTPALPPRAAASDTTQPQDQQQ